MLMNQQDILNEMSLNRNKHKTRLCIEQLKNYCDQMLTGTYFYIFPRNSGLVVENSVFKAT